VFYFTPQAFLYIIELPNHFREVFVMVIKTPYARTEASNSRETRMREGLAPLVLKGLGEIVSNCKVKGMQFIEVQPSSGPSLVVWVKCAWKPETHGNCAVQMAFPGIEDRANTADEVVSVVVEKTERAKERGATHLLLLAADDNGLSPLAAYLLPVDTVSELVCQAVDLDFNLTKNGASPSIYIVASRERQQVLVELTKNMALDLLHGPIVMQFSLDAIDDLNTFPEGIAHPGKTNRMSSSYDRDPAIRAYVIKRANGHCEYCGEKGFLMEDGKSFYLEAHHIIALAYDGKDSVDNVIALCPSHHKEAHFGASKSVLEKNMTKKVKKLNQQ
jgi:5-methylcytosine-specific restriction protein A